MPEEEFDFEEIINHGFGEAPFNDDAESLTIKDLHAAIQTFGECIVYVVDFIQAHYAAAAEAEAGGGTNFPALTPASVSYLKSAVANGQDFADSVTEENDDDSSD